MLDVEEKAHLNSNASILINTITFKLISEHCISLKEIMIGKIFDLKVNLFSIFNKTFKQ